MVPGWCQIRNSSHWITQDTKVGSSACEHGGQTGREAGESGLGKLLVACTVRAWVITADINKIIILMVSEH